MKQWRRESSSDRNISQLLLRIEQLTLCIEYPLKWKTILFYLMERAECEWSSSIYLQPKELDGVFKWMRDGDAPPALRQGQPVIRKHIKSSIACAELSSPRSWEMHAVPASVPLLIEFSIPPCLFLSQFDKLIHTYPSWAKIVDQHNKKRRSSRQIRSERVGGWEQTCWQFRIDQKSRSGKRRSVSVVIRLLEIHLYAVYRSKWIGISYLHPKHTSPVHSRSCLSVHIDIYLYTV